MAETALRPIRRVFVHHSGGPRSQSYEEIEAYHRLPKSKGGKGYQQIAYHYVILGDAAATLRAGRPVATEGAHALGNNRDSIGICLVGDNTRPGEEWTAEQIQRLAQLRVVLGGIWPAAVWLPHSAVVATQCPGVDLRALGL